MINEVFIYDGTFQGFCTVIYAIFNLKRKNVLIKTEDSYEQDLFSVPTVYETKEEWSIKVIRKLNSIHNEVYYIIYTAFLADNIDKENIICNYIKLALAHGKKIIYEQHLPAVIEIITLQKKVSHEAHRFTGFIRFKEVNKNLLYAEFEPDHNIITFLCNHFKERLSQESWILHDKKHKVMALYSKGQICLTDDINFQTDLIIPTQNEFEFQKLWQEYFKTIAIEERTNSKCQLNFMPRRYWKYLLETEVK